MSHNVFAGNKLSQVNSGHTSPLRVPTRSPKVNDRMLGLKHISSLHGDIQKKRSGLLRYLIILARMKELAKKHSPAKRSKLGIVDGFVVDRLDVVWDAALRNRKLLIVAGSHGDTDIAGVEAALRVAENALTDKEHFENYDITIIPAISPTAIVQQSRKNKHGQDFDNAFTKRGSSKEAQLIQELFKHEHFDLVLELHASKKTKESYAVTGGYEQGFANKFMRGAIPANYLGRNKKKSGDRRFVARGVAAPLKRESMKNWLFKQGKIHSYRVVVPATTFTDQDATTLVKIVQSAIKKF